MKLAIVIPAYNEGPRVGATVKKIKSFSQDWLVFVVNDCSTDNTAESAKDAGAEVVTHLSNKGYDGALSTGFDKVLEQKCTHMITFDADGQHPADQIQDYIDAFLRGYQLVLGVRPETQRLSESIFGYYTFLRFRIRDPLCGMKGFDLSVLETKLKDVKKFDSFGSTNTELMLRYLKANIKPIQIPLQIYSRAESSSRFGSVIRGNLRIFKSMFKGILEI